MYVVKLFRKHTILCEWENMWTLLPNPPDSWESKFGNLAQSPLKKTHNISTFVAPDQHMDMLRHYHITQDLYIKAL
jgi:hypothetical protein